MTLVTGANTATNGLSAYGSAIGLGGTLNQNTTINQLGNSLAFTPTTTNGFSVDGSTFSVDAANDRVGIGTATPSDKLHVAGSVFIPNGASYWIGNNGDANDRLRLHLSGANSYIDYATGDLNFRTGTTQKVVFNSAGNVKINNLAGTGNRPVYADASGTLVTTSPASDRVAWLEDRSQKTHGTAKNSFQSVGGTTTNLSVVTNDVVVINITLKYAFSGGSGADDVKFRLRIAGSCGNIDQTDTYEFEDFDNNRDEYEPVALQYIWVATCSGNVNFQLWADNNTDANDSSKYGDLVIVATKY
jgi:hypothetical protein